jgi:hypothetical protein
MVAYTGVMGRIYAVSEDVSVERLPVAQAAEVLGVTRDAIHKRIHRGTIEYEKGEDGHFYVYVDTSTEGLDSSTDMSKNEFKVETLERLIANQEDRISFLERELERRGDEAERLHQIVAGLTRATAELSARLPELEAPAAPQEQRESPESPGSSVKPLPRSEEALREPQSGLGTRRSSRRVGLFSARGGGGCSGGRGYARPAT